MTELDFSSYFKSGLGHIIPEINNISGIAMKIYGILNSSSF